MLFWHPFPAPALHVHPLQVLLFNQLQLQQRKPRLCLTVLDGQPRLPPADVLSVVSWCLAQHLVKLSIGPLAAACPGDVLLMLATLKQLQELKLQVNFENLCACCF
jgi:hypothetical protein